MTDFDALKTRCMALEEELMGLLMPYQKSRDVWCGVSGKMAEVKDVMGRMGTVEWREEVAVEGGRCFRECGQSLWLGGGEVQSLGGVVGKLEELRDAVGDSISTGSPRGVFKPCLARSIVDLKECDRLLSKAKFTPYTTMLLPTPLSPVTHLLESLVTLKPVLSSTRFSEVDEVIKRCIFDVEEAVEEQAMLSQEGRIEQVEKQYNVVIVKQEHCCAQLRKKISDVTEISTDVTASRERANSILNFASGQYDDTLKEAEELRVQCVQDHGELLKHAAAREDEHLKTTDGFCTTQSDWEKTLQQNAHRQQEIWATIISCERELNKLARERYTGVQQWVQVTEENERSRCGYSKFTEWVGERQKALQKTIENCETTTKLIRYLKKFIGNRKETVTGYFNTVSEKLRDVKDDAHKNFLDIFREMYLTAGDLRAKKMQLLEKTEEAMQNEKMKLALCQESFDPNAREHASRVKVLEKDTQDLREQVDKMHHRQTDYLTWFKPTETALFLTPTDSTHPVAALSARDTQRQAKLSAYKELITQPDAPLLPAPPKEAPSVPLDWAVKRVLVTRSRGKKPAAAAAT